MSATDITDKLEQLIPAGRLQDIRDILDTTNERDIKVIEAVLDKRDDPVILAVKNKREDIAVYLIDKGFRFNKPYKILCECETRGTLSHTNGECIREYNVLYFANKFNLNRVVSLIQEIQNGSRTLGQGHHHTSRDGTHRSSSKSMHNIGAQLKQHIKTGNMGEIQHLLRTATSKHIQKLETEFVERSAIALAIDERLEDIVLYLIEKGFKRNKTYHYPGQHCDQWCYFDHQGGPCPTEYTLIEYARSNNMPRVVTLVQEIENGLRKPGDRLVEQSNVIPGHGNKFETLIKDGKLREIRGLLDTMKSGGVADIEAQFKEIDPVMLAVGHMNEDVAIYLIEKGFDFNKKYNYPDQRCDQWCYYDHGEAKCPCEYDVLELAQNKRQTRVVSLIQDIQKGLRKPGDGLAGGKKTDRVLRIHREHGRKTVSSNGRTPTYTPLSESKTSSIGSQAVSKNGDTPLHQSAYQSAARIHMCVNDGVNVNAKNFDGDTALHIAVRNGNLDAAKALCSNGSDLTIRNKLSQTPTDMSEGIMKTLLESYRRGIVSAIVKGEHSAFARICRLWPNPDAVVKSGRTVMQLALEHAEKGPGQQACYNLLKENTQSMRLVHAVLSEDVEKLKQILQTPSTAWNINVRYKDKHGETPLSCAVERRSVELVNLLIETELCNVNIRVREHSWTDNTVPLKFKSLTRDCPVEIWRLLENNSDASQLTARDFHGNTALLRAISNNKPANFIQMMLKSSSGHNLIHRNTEGLHARELAVNLKRSDVVDIIDQFICEHPKYFLINLAVAFYGESHLDIRNVEGTSLTSISHTHGTEADIKATTQYKDVEANGVRLFQAAARGDVTQVARGNTANYQDKNGFTALIRAIVFLQVKAAEALLTTRPVLCGMPDNHGRYPLHYAYALPEQHGKVFIKLLMQRFGDGKDHSSDKDGRLPAEYQKSRDSHEVLQMLNDARTLDAYGKKGQPMATLPDGAVVL